MLKLMTISLSLFLFTIGLPADSERMKSAHEDCRTTRSDGKKCSVCSPQRIKKTRLWGYWGFLATADLYAFHRLQNLWYKSPTTRFHFLDPVEELNKYKQMDKIGHMTHAYFAARVSSQAYRWAGMSFRHSVYYGALTSFIWMLQIEIADGFFQDWGFSAGDFLANILGSGYAALQQLHPEQLEGIKLKISYWPSQAHRDGLYNDINSSMIDDYEGMTFWLAMNIYSLLPRRARANYPAWLKPFGLALGYSAKGIANNYFGGHREILVALDIDLNRLPLRNNAFIKIWLEALDLLHLPLPAVRLTPGTVWYGFYF